MPHSTTVLLLTQNSISCDFGSPYIKHSLYIFEDGEAMAVVGYRIGESLAWGRSLYVDDLVTRSSHRSHDYGAALLSWLMDLAVKAVCQQVRLNSGVHRTDAHRFYAREGMERASAHFRKVLTPHS